MLFNPEIPIENQHEAIKSKQIEIVLLTKELRSHYYQGKYFADPDKTFNALLEKIIHFFEKDDLPSKIEESEYLYQKYKDKYQNALQLIAALSEEKNKLSKILNYAKKKPNWFINQNYLDDDNLLFKAVEADIDNNYEVLPSSDNDKDSIVHYSHNDHLSLIASQTVSPEEHEKLKEELITTLNQRNFYESECIDLKVIQLQNKVLKEDYERINEINNNQYNSIKQLEQERKVMIDQLNRITKDKDDTYQAMNILREKLNIAETEMTSLKIKNVHHLSKFKFLEKELAKGNKKNQSLNSNIKELSDKLHQEYDKQQIMQQHYEEIIEELENKVVRIENEKKRVIKDTMAVFIESTAKGMNNLSLACNSNIDNIEIYYDDEVIGEVSNLSKTKDKNNKDKAFTDNGIIENKSPLNLSKEATICRFKQLSCYNQHKHNYSTKKNSPYKNYSLKKLFSNHHNFTISNKKSFESNSVFDNNDKENMKNSFNLNKITLNSIGKGQHYNNNNINTIIIEKKRDNKPHLSSNKKTTCFNSGTNLAHCILSANISKEGLTFTNSKTDHNKVQLKEFASLSICSNEQMIITHKSIIKDKSKSKYIIENSKHEYIGKVKVNIELKTDKIVNKDQIGNHLPQKEIREMKSFNDDTYYSEDMIVDTHSKDKDSDNNNKNKKKKENKEGKCNGCLLF